MSDISRKNLTVYLVADEKKFLGETEYAQALALNIAKHGQLASRDVVFLKQPHAPGASRGPFNASDSLVNVLPFTPDSLAALPVAAKCDAVFFSKYKSIDVVGVGRSTLEGACSFADQLRDERTFTLAHKFCRSLGLAKSATHVHKSEFISQGVDAKWLTHKVDDAPTLINAAQQAVHVFSTATYDDLRALHPRAASMIKFTHLAAMPHTNTPEACGIEEHKFLNASIGGSYLQDVVLRHNIPFAFVTINAGFKDEGQPYKPNTEKEAHRHGFALATGLPKGTAAIVYAGGHRAGIDKKEHGQDTLMAFAQGFRDGAEAVHNEFPCVIVEDFTPGQKYHTLKAGLSLARRKNCVAFIAPAEGYGAMDGARLLVNNREVLLGMFPFAAVMDGGQRERNVEKYHGLGIAKLSADASGRLVVDRHPQQKSTPQLGTRDGAEHVNDALAVTRPYRAGYAVASRARPAL